MRRPFAAAVATIALLIGHAAVAAVPPGPDCCACVPNRICIAPPERALLCSELIGLEEHQQFLATCGAKGGVVTCFAPSGAMSEPGFGGDNVDCDAVLLAEQITCPQGDPAPLLDRRVLAGLSALLAGLGMWTVRRRRA